LTGVGLGISSDWLEMSTSLNLTVVGVVAATACSPERDEFELAGDLINSE